MTNARTSWGWFQHDLHKISSQGPAQDHARAPRGFHPVFKMLRPLTAFGWDLRQIFLQGPVQGHALQGPLRGFHQDQSLQDLLTRERPWPRPSCQDPLRESHKIVIKGPAAAGEDLARSWYKNLPRASHKGFRAGSSNRWHLEDLHARTSLEDFTRISIGSSHKDLYKIAQGPVTGFHQDLHSIFSHDLNKTLI